MPFSDDFKQQLLAELPDLDAQCDGVLIHSENFQALGLMQQKYREHVKCIYIDPPYNTKDGDFVYKDNYKNSSWLSMIQDRVLLAKGIANRKARFFCSIDDRENSKLLELLFSIFGRENYLNAITWEKRTKSQNTKTSKYMLQSKVEYIHPFVVGGGSERQAFSLEVTGKKTYPLTSEKLGQHRIAKMEVSTAFNRPHDTGSMVYEILGIHPGIGKSWQIGKETVNLLIGEERLLLINNWPHIIFRPEDEDQDMHKPFWSHFFDKEAYGTAESGLNLLDKQLGFGKDFQTVKPLPLLKKLIFHVTKDDDCVLDFFSGSGTTGHAVIDQNREDGGRRSYIMTEMGTYFYSLMLPRIAKSIYSREWSNGKPVARDGISHCFKYLRLESYEDTLNNLVLKADSSRDMALANNADLQRDYLLNYFLDVETQASQSLLNIADFRDPTAYKMNIKKPGSEEQSLQAIDLIETFNWLIGLWVQNMAAPHSFSAEFEREQDPDLPKDQNTRLTCKRLKVDNTGDYWFRLIEGYTLKVPGDNTSKVATLIIWRKQTDDAEKDNAVLQKFLLEKLQISPRAQTYGVIYINGSHTLPNPVVEGEQTKVRLIEEAFHNAMWSGDAS